MGSYMIWKIDFYNQKSKDKFEKFLKKECIKCKLIHKHQIKKDYEMADFLYDVGYVGYTEAAYLKNRLMKLGVRRLEQSCLCDTGTFEVVIQ